MLRSLFLRDFVIVDRAEIDFESGFCALSGETGAGKSILLDALGLALGARADGSAVRSGAKRTEITASFLPSDPVQQWLLEHDLANDDDEELLLRRVIDAQGRSRSFINGSPVKLAQLRTLGDQVLEIHGQHASQSLLRTDGQRDLLDNYANLTDACATVLVGWRRWQSASKTLAEASSHRGEMDAERERLSWQLEEIDALGLQAGEWDSLCAEQNRLANASELIDAAQTAVQALTASDDALDDRLARLIGQLQIGARLDKQLEEAVDLLETARIQVTEAASGLGSYLDGVEVDPGRLELVEQRVAGIFRLARKLAVEPAELDGRAAELGERLNELQRAQNLDQLQAEVQQLEKQYLQSAGTLDLMRRKAAKLLVQSVSGRLEALGMPAARFDIAVKETTPGPHGTSTIEFQFAGHTSIDLRPLVKVASGGELSRVSLAIAVSAAQANPVQSLIFDEADAGVGGSVADAIGLLMRTLGESRQVLAVTHLPQVAARAHHHFRVSKQSHNGKISSTVQALSESERIDEIARMLGGARVTATTREHAQELLRMGKSLPPSESGPTGKGQPPAARSKTGRAKPAGAGAGARKNKSPTSKKIARA